MRRISIIAILAALVISCGGNDESVDTLIEEGDLSALKARKQELNEQQQELKGQLQKINAFLENVQEKTQPQLVTLHELEPRLFEHYVEVQGDIATDENIIIFPEYSGVLSSLLVTEGDRVKKGQLLAKVEDAGLSNQLQQLETQAQLAKTTFERRKSLWDQQIGSEMQFLESQTNYQSALESVEQTRKQLAKTEIRAPFSGEVDNVIAEEGQVVNQGQTQIMRIVNLNDMYVKAAVPENYLGSIEKGSQVIVEIDAIGEIYKGVVRQVGNYIDPDTRKFTVEIALPNIDKKIKPNLIADVKINNYSNPNAILIPETILQENVNGNVIAYLYKPVSDSVGVAEKVILELGLNYDNEYEVETGLQAGDLIVVEGAKNIRDGQRIAPISIIED